MHAKLAIRTSQGNIGILFFCKSEEEKRRHRPDWNSGIGAYAGGLFLRILDHAIEPGVSFEDFAVAPSLTALAECRVHLFHGYVSCPRNVQTV